MIYNTVSRTPVSAIARPFSQKTAPLDCNRRGAALHQRLPAPPSCFRRVEGGLIISQFASQGAVNLTTVLTRLRRMDCIGLAGLRHQRNRNTAIGAAYVRRYVLFISAGIAGEDDLDAPDLTTPAKPASGPERPKAVGEWSTRSVDSYARNGQ
jgi:hypothetical protein